MRSSDYWRSPDYGSERAPWWPEPDIDDIERDADRERIRVQNEIARSNDPQLSLFEATPWA